MFNERQLNLTIDLTNQIRDFIKIIFIIQFLIVKRGRNDSVVVENHLDNVIEGLTRRRKGER